MIGDCPDCGLPEDVCWCEPCECCGLPEDVLHATGIKCDVPGCTWHARIGKDVESVTDLNDSWTLHAFSIWRDE